MEPRFPHVLVDVDASQTEDLIAEFFSLGATGVEERDATTLVKAAVVGKVTLAASFADEAAARAAMAELASWTPRFEEIVGDAWRDAWKEHFRPFPIAPGIVIRPPWEAFTGEASHVLELEPGRAFGTGLHETTSLVAGALSARVSRVRDRDVLDVGCGSGILSLVALAIGARHVRAVDIDPDAVAVTRENASRNGMGDRVTCDTADIVDVAGQFPVVLANIEARVLVPMARAIGAHLAPNGIAILSGILAHQEAEIREAYRAFDVAEVVKRGEWIAVVLEKKV